MRKLLLLALLAGHFACHSQPGFTAEEVVPLYDEPFGFGSNMGYYPPYTDENLAALVHGLPDGSTPGIGVNCIRPALPEDFLDYWGYTIRESTFRFYDSIGLKNGCVFLGFPAPKHRDSTIYCSQRNDISVFFKNMYEPIWDNGQNGTPVNDNNPAAVYIWKTVQVYGPYVKFWEIWNEPDFDIGGNAWKPVGIEGNWWLNQPQPCETTTHAPVFHYIRLLRIAFEVIKDSDPDDLVCVGGIGYPAYLDVLLRNSDNPNDGKVSTKFPKKGGAYFDCLSYHSYPHIEGATRAWDNAINDFRHFRHSDACVDGVFQKKSDFEVVLNKYHFDGNMYPRKHWIVTEFNIPRKEFGEYIGSDQAQSNFMVKTLAMAQAHDIDQMYVYNLSDNKIGPNTDNEFSFMGLYKNLEGKTPYEAVKNAVATAFHTTAMLLDGWRFDAVQTGKLALPTELSGAAFKNQTGKFQYVLWAKTTLDRSEVARADYRFPASFGIKYLTARQPNFSQTKAGFLVNAAQVRLTGEPVFLQETTISEPDYDKNPRVFPNPIGPDGSSIFSFWLFEKQEVSVELYDSSGRLVRSFFRKIELVEGAHQILVEGFGLSAGAYFVRLKTKEGVSAAKFVRL